MASRSERLFLILGAFFITNALLAEFVGAKIFSVELSLGLQPLALGLFGTSGISFNMTAGVLMWPVVFVMTDVVNEYFGQKGVKTLSYLAVLLIVYAFAMVLLAVELAPAPIWAVDADTKIDMDLAFRKVFGQGLWIIAGSVIAFLVAQLVDAFVFRFIRKRTGAKLIWLRATGSTVVSQLIDSFVVLFIAFYIGADWPAALVLAVASVNYLYKVGMAVLLTPVLYVVHAGIKRYLGEEASNKLMAEATRTS